MTLKNLDFQQLNVVVTEYDKVWCYCIFHKDTIRPNLSISLLDKYYGKYRCWACGETGRLSKEQMDKLNLSNTPYKNKKDSLLTRWKLFNESCYDNLQKFPLLKLGLAKELNVTMRSLDRWLVGYDGQSFTIPMFREDLREYVREYGFCGIQRRFSDGSKRCVRGSHLGYTYSYNWLNTDKGYMFICEGFSDGISVGDLGLPCMSRPNCHYKDGIIDCLRALEFGYGDDIDDGLTIIIIPDNDDVGKDGAYELFYELEDYYSCSIFTFSGAKDIREYIAKVGKQQVKKELLRYTY